MGSGLTDVFVDEPELYLRLTARFRLTWRRELATIVAVFALGALVGLVVSHL